MSMLQMAAQLFLKNMGGGSQLDAGSVSSALQGLLPTNGGDIDLGQLVSMLGSGDMMSMVGSWLGDGDNDAMSGSSILGLLGEDKISSFASQLGIDSNQASDGLAGMIPELIDGNSNGGSLLDAAGGLGGMADIAKKLF